MEAAVRSRFVRSLWLRCCVVGALLCAEARAGDPYLEWYTLSTRHFRVHYHSGLEEIAQRVANIAEEANARLVPVLGYAPSSVTHILLRDTTDDANGSATATPYNAIRLFVTAPDDMSPLGDYDDWILELVTHEHTHVLHIDNIHGIPAVVNSIIGKTWAPNQLQPRWFIEGLAVHEESAHTSGGRVRSTLFDMFLRADVLEGNFVGLDRLSHNPRRWPRGHIWYLYGGRFLDWIADIYGPEVFAAVSTDYGQMPVQWGINRSIRRATGRTYPELYDAWQKDLEHQYGQMVRKVRKRGLREGVRLTHRGSQAANPRFVPKKCRSGNRDEILYYADDGHVLDGFYKLPLSSPTRADEEDAELVIRTRGDNRQASFDPDCGIVYDSVGPTGRRYYFQDLYYQPPGTTSPWGSRGSRERWTKSLRARDPDVSSDGRWLTFVTNHQGTTTLRIADILPGGGLSKVRALVPSARFEQAFTPRFSPDGTRVAYSVWTNGGYRDIRIVNTLTGAFENVTHDRALDQQPAWSPDGRTLYFVSDRSGIANVYAYELDSRALHQVTNVVNGAYMPAVSPNGRTLVYVGYTHEGFDLYSMPLERSKWLPAPPELPLHPDPPGEPRKRQWPVESYNALPTLRPRALDFEYGVGTFGRALTVRVEGSDIVDLHSVALSATYHSRIDNVTWVGDYFYGRLPFTFNASVFRDIVPRRVVVDGEERPINAEILGGSTALSYDVLGDFDAQNVSVSYTVSRTDANLDVGSRLDPVQGLPVTPFRGMLASVGLGWNYSNVQSPAYSRQVERGYTLSLNTDLAARETGSDKTLRSISGRVDGYVPLPWVRHHVLALGLGFGAAGGTYPDRGFFSTGGFADEDVIETFRSGVRQSAFVLRGYEPGKFVGRQFNLLNLEYRFPIWFFDHGVSTLPAYIGSIYGTVFADYGGAFDQIDLDDPLDRYHLGSGAEVLINLVIGYQVGGALRLGWAKGFDDEAIPGSQFYFVISSSF